MSPNDNKVIGLNDKIEAARIKLEKGEQLTYDDKIKVAVLADSPTVVTGFGNVCREVLANLYATGLFEFEIVGINYDGSPHNLPYKIYPAVNALVPDPAYREPYGRQRFLDLVCTGRFDIVWVLQDSFIVAQELAQRICEANAKLEPGYKFQFIYYFPIDAVPKKSWIDQSALMADFPVVYTRYGYSEVMKLYAVGADTKLTPEQQQKNKEEYELMEAKLQIVYHGSNTKAFYPIESAEELATLRERLWGPHKDKFIFMNLNRNQPRKDLFRTLQAFKILLDRRRAKGKDDVYLYLHCALADTGLNLVEMSKQINLVEGEEYAFPDPKMFSTSSGYPVEVVNQMYNASDCVVTTTLGEGWGLSITEGMAVKKPVIAPDHTSISEILGKLDAEGSQGAELRAERGFLVKTKGEFVQHDDNSRIRPITDPEHMADVMEWVMEHPEDVKGVVERAYEWVKTLEWTGPEIGHRWIDIFTQAYQRTLSYRAISYDRIIAEQLKNTDLGRNDVCPLCNIKYKKCRHYENKS